MPSEGFGINLKIEELVEVYKGNKILFKYILFI